MKYHVTFGYMTSPNPPVGGGQVTVWAPVGGGQ